MEYGQIVLAAVSCRAEASHRAEQITQLLFGESYTVLEKGSDWYKVLTAYDNYTCWIHKKHHAALSKEEFKKRQSAPASVSLDLLGVLKGSGKINKLNIPIGSSLYFSEKHTVKIDDSAFKYKGELASQKKGNLFDYAFLYLHTPYLWGGRTPLGIDCSGFVQMTHKLCGIKLPRDSPQQAKIGKQIKKLSEAKAGDLCFFGEDTKINHVGLLLDKTSIIHASGKVRIDKMDEKGIYNEDLKTYTHLLKTIKRV